MSSSVQQQAEAIAEQALANAKPDYSRLTRAEVASILSLTRAGKTQTEIAQVLKCNVSTVSRWLAQLEDTTELAKQRLRNSAEALSERVIREADVEQSLEVLDRLDVLPKKERSTQHTGIQIVIGMPGSPAGPDPVIDATFAST